MNTVAWFHGSNFFPHEQMPSLNASCWSYMTELFVLRHWLMSFFHSASGEMHCWPNFGFNSTTSHSLCCIQWFQLLYACMAWKILSSFRDFYPVTSLGRMQPRRPARNGGIESQETLCCQSDLMMIMHEFKYSYLILIFYIQLYGSRNYFY